MITIFLIFHTYCEIYQGGFKNFQMVLNLQTQDRNVYAEVVPNSNDLGIGGRDNYYNKFSFTLV